MMMNPAFQQQFGDVMQGPKAADRALQLFRDARSQATRKAFFSRLFGRCRALPVLNQSGGPRSAYGGLRSVLLSDIRGSEDRDGDFDADFLPLHERARSRWMSVARARYQGRPLPPVKLLRVGDSYFVRDGHHRISVAHMLGEVSIDAEVLAA